MRLLPLPSVKDSGVAFEKGRVMEYLESIADENGGILLPKRGGLFVGMMQVGNMGFIPYNRNVINRGEENRLIFEVEFYTQANGTCPIKEFLNSLDHKLRAKL